MYHTRFDTKVYSGALDFKETKFKIPTKCNSITFRVGLVTNFLVGDDGDAYFNPDIQDLFDCFPTVNGVVLVPDYHWQHATLDANPAIESKTLPFMGSKDLVFDAGHVEGILTEPFDLVFPALLATGRFNMTVHVIKRFIQKVANGQSAH